MHVHRGGDGERPGATAEVLGSFVLGPAFRSSALSTLHCAERVAPGNGAGQYVVKRLQRRHLGDPELRQLLLRAGRAGLGRNTPHLLRTLEVYEDPEPFLVLERGAGVDLEQLLQLGESQEAVRWLMPVIVDVLLGLSALHEAGASAGRNLVHGAPCARHVLVGVDGVARLLDLTHAVGPELPWAQPRSAILAGRELAPEQVLAPAHVDARCDLFIVGRLLWQVLTGMAPFPGEGEEPKLESMLRVCAVLPSEAGSRAGRGLDAVCMRALQKVRGARYATAMEMALEVRREAERAGLWAAREEIGQWVESARRRLRVTTSADAAYKGETIHGIGPVDDIVRETSNPTKSGAQAGTVSSSGSRRGAASAKESAAAQAFPYVVVADSAAPELALWGNAAQEESRWREVQPSMPPRRARRGRARSFVWFAGLCAAAAGVVLALPILDGAPAEPEVPAPNSADRPAAEPPTVEAAAARAPVPLHAGRTEAASEAPATELPEAERREASSAAAAKGERTALRAEQTARRPPRPPLAERARTPTPARAAGASFYERAPQGATAQPKTPDVPDNPYE